MMPSPTAIATASLIGRSTTTPSLSRRPSAEAVTPRGSLAIAPRSPSAAAIRMAAKASHSASAPNRSHKSLTRPAPIWVTAICACMSPRTRAREDAADQVAIDRRMEKHRRRDDQPAVTVENHARKVARFTNDGGVAGAIEMIVHLLDQACDLVAQDLDGDGAQRGVHFSRLPL